uniref:Uncharacterized protein n=1 Tax=Arundo donax TaxID=35708 RepID=A0A0A9CJD2_ARUDO
MEGEKVPAGQLQQHWLLWISSWMGEVAKPRHLPYLAGSIVDLNIEC